MIWTTRTVRCIVILGVTILSGMGCQHEIGTVGFRGVIQVYEHNHVKKLDVLGISYTQPLLGGSEIVLADFVPESTDAGTTRRIHDLPSYRRKNALYRIIELLARSDGYPWKRRTHWVLGTDSLILGIGGEQGSMDPRDPAAELFPFVSRAAESQVITHVVKFEAGTWAQLETAKQPGEVLKVPHRIIESAKPTPIRDILVRSEL